MFKALILALFAIFATACTEKSETLTVLAGSELKDLEPLFGDIEKNTGIKLVMNYSGTLDGAEKLISGGQTDLAWFSHGKYIDLIQGQNKKVLAQEKTMLSPVVMGVKESIARAWGWIDNPKLTWRDLAAKSANGELRYAMTDPTTSNSGFTALVGVATAFSGTGDALRPQDVNQAELGRFFQGQQLTAGSSGWLVDTYVKEQNRLNGMINYESVLMRLNESGQLHEKLVLIYPAEGIITADYPIMLVNGQKRESYNKLVAYLTTPEFQQKIMEQTLRRPVVPQVKLSPVFSSQILVELPFPNDLDAIDKLLFAYQDKHRRPSHTFYVLDVSGSMEGSRLDALKAALKNLTGLDQSLAGRFSRFRSREILTFIPFDNQVYPAKTFTIDNSESQSPDMQAIRDYIDTLQPRGQTAIFQAMGQAYYMALLAKQVEPGRFFSIVLMSDGENNSGIAESELESYIQTNGKDQNIKAFTILFGEAKPAELESLANLTGGRLFDGRNSLNQVFKTIRGYQ